MKSLSALSFILGTLALSRLSADVPTRWLSPNHKLEASTLLCHEPERPDRDDLNWDVVTVKNASGSSLASLSLEEGSGINRAMVGDAVWSPDSRFFVFETESSGAHSIWHWPTYVYDALTSKIYSIDDTLGAVTCNNDGLKFLAEDCIKIEFYNMAGGGSDPYSITKTVSLPDFVKNGAKVALHAQCFVHAAH